MFGVLGDVVIVTKEAAQRAAQGDEIGKLSTSSLSFRFRSRCFFVDLLFKLVSDSRTEMRLCFW